MTKIRIHTAKCLNIIIENVKKNTTEINIYLGLILQKYKKVSEKQNNPNQEFILKEYISLLRQLIFDRKFRVINLTQKKIITGLINDPSIFKGIKELIRFDQSIRNNEDKLENDDLNHQKLNFIVQEILQIFSLISKHNQICSLQIQKLIEYDEIKSVLTNKYMPYLYKKQSLQCFYWLYINNLDYQHSQINQELLDTLNKIIIQDLKQYGKYIDGILPLNDKDALKRLDLSQFSSKQEAKKQLATIRQKFQVKIQQYKKQIQLENDYEHQINSNDQKYQCIIKEKSEYWTYLLSGKSRDHTKYGLLYFFLDISNDFYKKQGKLNESLISAFDQIRIILNKIKQKLITIQNEKEFDGMINLKEEIFLIVQATESIAQNQINKAGYQVQIKNKSSNINSVLLKNNDLGKQPDNKNATDTKESQLTRKEQITFSQSEKSSEISQKTENQIDPEDVVQMVISYLEQKRLNLIDFQQMFGISKQIMKQSQFIDVCSQLLIDTSHFTNISQINEQVVQILNHYQEMSNDKVIIVKEKNVAVINIVELFKQIELDIELIKNYCSVNGEINFQKTQLIRIEALQQKKEQEQQKYESQNMPWIINNYTQEEHQEQLIDEYFIKKNYKKFLRLFYSKCQSTKNLLFKEIKELSVNIERQLFGQMFQQIKIKNKVQILQEKYFILQKNIQQDQQLIKYLQQIGKIFNSKDHYQYFLLIIDFIMSSQIRRLKLDEEDPELLEQDINGYHSCQDDDQDSSNHEDEKDQKKNINLNEESLNSKDQVEEFEYGQFCEEQDKQKDELEKYRRKIFEGIQDFFSNSFAVEYALNIFTLENSGINVYASVSFLNKLLLFGNHNSQKKILDIFKSRPNLSQNFMTYIRQSMREQTNRFRIEQVQKKESQKIQLLHLNESDHHFHSKSFFRQEIIIIYLLRLSKLLCENVFQPFQNYFREQDKQLKNFIHINIIQEIQNFIANSKNYFDCNNLEYLSLIQQSFMTLSEFCTGPNILNQEQVCNDQKLIEYIKECILKMNINFRIEQQNENQVNNKRIQVFSECIDFLLNVVNQNQNAQSLIQIIKNVDIEALINCMHAIYLDQINDRIFYIHKIDFSEKEYEDQFQIIKTGFNIFMFLQILKDFQQQQKTQDLILKNLDLNVKFDQQKYNDLLNDPVIIFINQLSYKMQGFNETSSILVHEHQVKSKKTFLQQQQEKLNMRQAQHKFGMTKQKTIKFIDQKDYSEKTRLLQPEEQNEKNQQQHDEKQKKQQNGFMKYAQQIFVKFENKKNENFKFIQPDQTQLQKVLVDNNITKEQYYQKIQDFQEILLIKKIRKCIEFYRQFIGSIEIVKRNNNQQTTSEVENNDNEVTISKIYFQKPFISKFLSEQIKNDLIRESDRDTDQDRVKYLLMNIKNYETQLLHYRKLARKHLFFGLNLLHSFKFNLVFVINILFLIDNLTYTDEITAIGSFLLVISLFIFIIELIQRYPVSISTHKLFNFEDAYKYDLKKLGGQVELEQSSIANIKSKIQENIKMLVKTTFNENSYYKNILIIFDSNNIYNICFFILAFISLTKSTPLYTFLMFDYMKGNPELVNVVNSVLKNAQTLIKTAALGLIVIYLFSIIGFLQFSQQYGEHDEGPSNTYANKLYLALTSTLNFGLRFGGGIGDVIKQAKVSDPNYWSQYAFQLGFFILINMLLLNMIFGIIIDTFQQLREESYNLEQDIQKKCFICGIQSQQFELKGQGWNKHIYLEHNVYHYLDFLIYVKNKRQTDCNGIEKYVKECLENQKIDFFPIQMSNTLKESEQNDNLD